MAQEPAGPAGRGLAQVCERASIAVGVLALVFTLLPALVEAGAPGDALVAWLVAAVAWTAALAVPSAVARAGVQVTVLLLLALVPLAAPAMSPVAWIPVPLVVLCASVAAALALPPSAGVLTTGAGLAITLASAQQGSGLFVTQVGQQAPWMSLPFIACIGLGLVVSRAYAERLTRRADAVARETSEATVLARRASRAAQARAAVDRRIHETVLNTLAAIANGGVGTDVLRRECRRDLEQMQLGFMPQADPGLSAIVRSAMQVAGTLQAVLSVDVLRDVDLDRGPAGALRDAMVEALRNVERHAQARTVHVTAAVEDACAVVVITDDGIGMPEQAQERFGVRNTIRSSLAGFGGGATVVSRPGEGTTVRLVVPIRIRPPELPPPLLVPARDRFIGRIGLLGPVLASAVCLPAVSADLSHRWAVLAVALAFTAACVALAWPHAVRVLRPLAWATVGLGLLLLLVTAAGVDVCTAAPAMTCVVVSVVGSLFIVLVDIGPGRASRVVALAIVLIASAVAIGRLPADCRVGVLGTFAVMTLFVVGLLGIILATVASLAAQERARQAAEDERRESDSQVAEILASRAAWGKVTGTTKEVLAAIADGTVDPTDAFVRDRARLEEAQLRARLSGRDTSGLWQAVVEAAEAAALSGRAVDLKVVGSGREPRPAPPSVELLVAALMSQAPSGSVSARAMFIDGQEEVLLAGPSALLQSLAADFADEAVVAEPIASDERGEGQLLLRWLTASVEAGEPRS